MSSLISSAELAGFVAEIQNHFDSFSQFHLLTIIKEPIKQIINVADQEYNGYGPGANPENYILIPQSGQYNCMTYEPDSWKDESFDQVPVWLSKGDIVFKVKSDANDYILNGKNNLVILDNQTYNIVGGPLHKSYGTQNYYYYSLERTT